ncbi:MAG: tyrosine-type recombinase/integrase [Dehalogenimonas sp.]
MVGSNHNPVLASRDTAIILILLYTDLRLSKITSIILDDIDFEHETITVIGKGQGKEWLGSIREP